MMEPYRMEAARGFSRGFQLAFIIFLLALSSFSKGAQASSPSDIARFLSEGQQIRIGLAVGVDTVQVQASGELQILSDAGRQLGVLSDGQRIEFQVLKDSRIVPAVTVYRIQVQAVKDRAKAQELAEQLKGLVPYSVHIVYVEPWYKVQVGDFATRQEAVQGKKLLANNGFTDSWLTTFSTQAQGEAFLDMNWPGMVKPIPRTKKVWLRPSGEESRVVFQGRQYRGQLAVFVNRQLSLTAVNVLPMSQYLYGVVAAEMGNARSNHRHALMAQAVAARSYAISHLGEFAEKEFDLLSSVLSQAYYGSERETELIREAVDATDGEVLVYGGEVISALYHSNAGGHTAFPDEVWDGVIPYLTGISETVDGTSSVLGAGQPGYQWEIVFNRQRLEEMIQHARAVVALPSGSKLQDIWVESRGPSGRVTQLRLETDRGSVVVKQDKIRWVLASSSGILPSTRFTIDKRYQNGRLEEITLRGWGAGHGLGMSQAGAMDLAAEGWTYREILARYYRYSALVSLDVYEEYARAESKLAQVGLMKTHWQGVTLPSQFRESPKCLAYSPDGARLAMVDSAGTGLWVWDGQNLSQVAGDSKGRLEFIWTDSDTLVYSIQGENGAEVYAANVLSGQREQLGTGSAVRSLSYDIGRQILYVEKDQLVQAYLFDAGVWLPLITDASFPAVSHSGDQLAFIRNGNLWVYNSRTGESVRMGEGFRPTGSMTWSPNDRYIAVQAEGVVIVFDLKGFKKVYSAKGSGPKWSEDGRFLGYIRQSSSSPQSDVFVVEPGKWHEFNATNTLQTSETQLAWDPNGFGMALITNSRYLLGPGPEGFDPLQPMVWQVQLSSDSRDAH